MRRACSTSGASQRYNRDGSNFAQHAYGCSHRPARVSRVSQTFFSSQREIPLVDQGFHMGKLASSALYTSLR